MLSLCTRANRVRTTELTGTPELEALPGLRNAAPLNFAAAADRPRRAGEARDLASDSDTAGQDFILTGAPAFVGDTFAAAVRSTSAMAGVLPVRELPQYGTSVTVPMLDGAASAAVQASDLDAVSNTDPTTANTEAPVVSIAGRGVWSSESSSVFPESPGEVVASPGLIRSGSGRLTADRKCIARLGTAPSDPRVLQENLGDGSDTLMR